MLGLIKILLLIAIGLLAYIILRPKRHNSISFDSDKMVQCKQCQLHIPVKEAIQHENDYFCSQDHLTLYHESKGS